MAPFSTEAPVELVHTPTPHNEGYLMTTSKIVTQEDFDALVSRSNFGIDVTILRHEAIDRYYWPGVYNITWSEGEGESKKYFSYEYEEAEDGTRYFDPRCVNEVRPVEVKTIEYEVVKSGPGFDDIVPLNQEQVAELLKRRTLPTDI
jgi:hypothetical protein